jgi:hypothetical protein
MLQSRTTDKVWFYSLLVDWSAAAHLLDKIQTSNTSHKTSDVDVFVETPTLTNTNKKFYLQKLKERERDHLEDLRPVWG